MPPVLDSIRVRNSFSQQQTVFAGAEAGGRFALR